MAFCAMAFFMAMHHFFDTLTSSAEKPIPVTGMRPASAAMLAAEAVARTGRSVLCVLPSEDLLAGMEQDVAFFSAAPVYCYPGYEIPPYTPLSPDSSTTAARLSTLYRVLTADSPFVLLCSVEALLRRILPLSLLDRGA